MTEYAYYALHKLNILPSEFANLSCEEKTFIMAWDYGRMEVSGS